jgi:hypothetical protein
VLPSISSEPISPTQAISRRWRNGFATIIVSVFSSTARAPVEGFVDQYPDEVARIVNLNAMVPVRLASAVAPRFAQAGTRRYRQHRIGCWAVARVRFYRVWCDVWCDQSIHPLSERTRRRRTCPASTAARQLPLLRFQMPVSGLLSRLPPRLCSRTSTRRMPPSAIATRRDRSDRLSIQRGLGV